MKRKRILIVDDEPHVIRVLRLALDNAGYQTEEACNGQQALEKIRSNPPDLLITDIDMPQMSGRELCSRIVEEMPGRNFGIYVLSARAEDEHRSWSKDMGNLDFLEKPVSIRRLLARLKEYFLNDNPGGEQQCLQIH
jgi:DNA-binding response OmpR family regulator